MRGGWGGGGGERGEVSGVAAAGEGWELFGEGWWQFVMVGWLVKG